MEAALRCATPPSSVITVFDGALPLRIRIPFFTVAVVTVMAASAADCPAIASTLVVNNTARSFMAAPSLGCEFFRQVPPGLSETHPKEELRHSVETRIG